MDPVSLAVGGAIALAFLAIGRLSRRRPIVQAAPTPYKCTCPHVLSEHDPTTGKCLASIRRENYLPGGSRNGWKWVQCPCATYVGDRPLPELEPDDIMKRIKEG